jgi:hypothetical protein
MNRVWSVAAGLAVAAGVMVLGASGAREEKEPTIKEIMTKAHKGGDSLLSTVGKDLKAAEPDWADVQTKSKELVKLGTSLGKNTPPKGEKESWEQLTKAYLDCAKTLEAAADKKDKETAAAAQKKLTTMCMNCHMVHRPPPPKK